MTENFKKKIRLKYEIFLFYYHHLSSLLNYWNLIIDYYLLNSVKQPRFGLFLHFFFYDLIENVFCFSLMEQSRFIINIIIFMTQSFQ